jgi:hypothetical protein
MDAGVSVNWFRKAAIQGYAKAQEKLAARYARGAGATRDVVEALKWAILATQQGRTSAQSILNDLRATMNDRQIAEAESRAKNFRSAPAGRR